jgi:Ser/Thr protein kinase RdoA (MazF antagonist)
MQMYELEVRFYSEVAPMLPAAAIPRCHHAALNQSSGEFTLVLEDLSTTTSPGSVLVPCSITKCAAVLDELAAFQAATWNSRELAALPWLADPARTAMFFGALPAGLDPLVERFGAKLESEHVNLFRNVLPQAGQWAKRWQPPTVLQHGDLRSDNILFGDGQTAAEATVVDFQTIRLGPPGFDLAYFIGSSLSTEDRRKAERDLVNGYHRRLLESGVEDFDAEACWTQYRAGAMYGVLLFAGAASQVASTERGDRFIVDQARRYAQMALDLDAPAAADFV